MIDHFLSALTAAWIITFVATTGLVTALAAESVWDSQVYSQALQDVLTTDPLCKTFDGALSALAIQPAQRNGINKSG